MDVPGRVRLGGVTKWVLHIERGVDPDLEVRVRSITVAVEVVIGDRIGRVVGRSGRLGGMSAGQ